MAYFAELDENNIVLRVVSISNADCQDESGNEVEALGVFRCKQLFGENTVWKQTSFNTFNGVHSKGGRPFRKNYAGVGYFYDEQRDAFYVPFEALFEEDKPFCTFDEEKCAWVDSRVVYEPEVQIGVTRV